MAMTTKNVKLYAATNADDLSFLSLFDACTLSKGKNVRIVGGQMVQLLIEAFPNSNSFSRRTVDADAALDSELADTGEMHEIFVAAGYEASSGNSYQKDGRSIDLLVASLDGKFSTRMHGERAFDASPGLSSALSTEPLTIQVSATLQNGEVLEFEARVPRVETALVIKALVYRFRLTSRDLLDVQNLLWISKHYPADEIGGWTLDTPAKGARGDAQRALHYLSENLSQKSVSDFPRIRPAELKQLISQLVAKPQ
jgi:hypothetical protein